MKMFTEIGEKEVFDVSKYKMEVLELANKWSTVGIESPSDLTDGEFEGLPTPPSSQNQNDGVKWISLTDIFGKMKRMDRTEAARTFYALLTLVRNTQPLKT